MFYLNLHPYQAHALNYSYNNPTTTYSSWHGYSFRKPMASGVTTYEINCKHYRDLSQSYYILAHSKDCPRKQIISLHENFRLMIRLIFGMSKSIWTFLCPIFVYLFSYLYRCWIREELRFYMLHKLKALEVRETRRENMLIDNKRLMRPLVRWENY